MVAPARNSQSSASNSILHCWPRHRHPAQEEVYFVISGTITLRVREDAFEAGQHTAVRMTGEECYSVHNDNDAEAELLIFSTRLARPAVREAGRLPAVIPSPVEVVRVRKADRFTWDVFPREANGCSVDTPRSQI
jgi:hypothetical protein